MALLIINEATDSTACFKLSTKYKEVAMWDGEEGEWRVVVGHEWSISNVKIPGIPCGNKKAGYRCVSS